MHAEEIFQINGNTKIKEIKIVLIIEEEVHAAAIEISDKHEENNDKPAQ